MARRHRSIPFVLLAAGILAGCSRAPATSARPSVEVSAMPSHEATPAASLLEATELEATTDPLPAGRYTREAFEPRITFELDGPWFAVQRFSGFFDVQQDVGSPDVIAVQFAKPSRVYGADAAGVLVEDAATAAQTLAQNPDLEILGTSESRIGGLTGQVVEVEHAAENGNASILAVPPGPLQIVPERRLWVAFFDTPDGLLAIMVGGSVAHWEKALATAEPVLESVTIGQ